MKERRKSKRGVRVFYIFLIAILLIFVVLVLNNVLDKKNGYNSDYKCPDCNVIIISITNLRYDHLGSNGYFRNTSPNIDELAEESIVFENAFSPSSWTLPAGISLFTSLYPFKHLVVERSDTIKLNPETITMVDILKSNGYKTAAFTGGFDYETKFGLTSRFDVLSTGMEHVPEENENSFLFGYGVLASSAPAALEWIESNKNQKFFLFLQGFDVHCPFTPPEPYSNLFDPGYKGKIDFSYCYWTFDKTEPKKIGNESYYEVFTSKIPITSDKIKFFEKDREHLIALYDGEIKYADSVIGNFLAKLKESGLYDNTIIVITSEHGDIFGKHGRFMRGGSLSGTFYDDVLHIPLIIKHPNLKPKRVGGLSQIMDVMPTILDFLNIKNDNEIEGKSLLPLILNGTPVHDFIFGGSLYGKFPSVLFNKSSKMEFIRSEEWKLVREQLLVDKGNIEETYELYNLKEDPEELNNIYYNKNIEEIREELRERLFDWLNQFNETSPFKS